MKRILFAIALFVAALSPALAEDADCLPLDAMVQMMTVNHREHVVLRGDAIAQWVAIKTDLGEDIPFTPDFVIVAFVPEKDTAFVVYGHGNQVCKPVAIPLDTAKSMLRPA